MAVDAKVWQQQHQLHRDTHRLNQAEALGRPSPGDCSIVPQKRAGLSLRLRQPHFTFDAGFLFIDSDRHCCTTSPWATGGCREILVYDKDMHTMINCNLFFYVTQDAATGTCRMIGWMIAS